nr:GNAT family N-acetyltransferase [uncultured Roseovarius sp.]
MTPDEMASLHARAFEGQGRAWSAREFTDLMSSSRVFTVGDARAFALGRVIADEVELLTLATDPDLRRQGLGRACLRAYETAAGAQGANMSFLEVARDNAAARALYLAEGYAEVACRACYYRRPDGGQVDALILQKTPL